MSIDDPNHGAATPNPWTCPLCGKDMTGAQRSRHLRDEHSGFRPASDG